VEFRNGIPKGSENTVTPLQTVGHCRFCNKSGNSGPLALGNICADAECQVRDCNPYFAVDSVQMLE